MCLYSGEGGLNFCLYNLKISYLQIAGTHFQSVKIDIGHIIDLTFDQDVAITEHFYPDFSLSNFFTELGGSLGLWLGLGATQLVNIGLDFYLWMTSSKKIALFK